MRLRGTLKSCRWLASMAVMIVASVSIAYSQQDAKNQGWRGDGTGRYPATNPPVTWSRISTIVKGLRFSAQKPAGPDAGTEMPDGVIRDWLIAGPLPLVQAGTPEEIALPDEAALEPDAGQEAGAKRWQKVSLDTAYLDFNRLLGKPKEEEVAALAFTHVYSPTGGKVRLNLTAINKSRIWLNGKKPANMGARMTLKLEKGWNRLLLHVSPGEKDWYAVPVMYGQGKCEYQESGILWHTLLPGIHPAFYGGGSGAGSPVIVGDKMYLQSEPHDLICLNKSDGKVQWIRRASYFEAATDEEKKNPAYQEAQALAAKIDAINTSFVAGMATSAQLQEKGKLETDLRKQMKLVDAKKYSNQYVPDVGFSGFTPCTDGRFIYAWFGDGVSACFDLEGKQRWLRVDQHAAMEHGFSSSPVLVDGKLVTFMRDLTAFDCDTGKLAWQTVICPETGDNPANFFHGSLAATAIGGVKVILLGNGMIIRASDGKAISNGLPVDTGSVASPVVSGKLWFHLTHLNADLMIRELPDHLSEPMKLSSRTVPLDVSAFPKHYLPWHLSCPLIHEGLAYMLNNAGVLTVIDVDAGRIVYQKLLDLDNFQSHNEGAFRGIGSSPILAGKNLYIMGTQGTALVLEPGREYRQLAKNKIENVVMLGHWAERQERFIANPVADGDRLFLRGEEGIYAVGAR